jgi:hypothetical protein
MYDESSEAKNEAKPAISSGLPFLHEPNNKIKISDTIQALTVNQITFAKDNYHA